VCIDRGGIMVGVKQAVLLAVILSLTACSDIRRAQLGVRPDALTFDPSTAACEQLKRLVGYSQSLQEAYHTRATQNRFWIYAAGTMALGTIAATGGLGAAGAAALSIALVSVSGGFTAGVFALIDNATLADVYTASADDIATAISEAQIAAPDSSARDSDCSSAYKTLIAKVTAAQTDLEQARTNSAVAEAVRLKAQLGNLQKIVASLPTTTTTSTTAQKGTTTSTSLPH